MNAHGDVEPCAFIHYADSNIREKTLLGALKSPLPAVPPAPALQRKPPAPVSLLDNPDILVAMVRESKLIPPSADNEQVETVAEKCRKAAERWAPVADKLWQERDRERAESNAEQVI